MKRPLPHTHATAGATRNLSYSVPTVTDNTLKRSAKTPSRRRLHWRSNEREAIRRGILMFGVGRSEKVRNVMRGSMKHLQHGLGDIADCSWDFVRACSTYSDVRDRVFVENLLMRAGDLGIEVGPDVSERVGRWEKIEKSGAIWVKRIRLLDNLGHVIQFCASPETQEIAYNAIDTLDDSTVPCDWWTRQSDLALLAGIYRHGFGNYEAIKTDEEFAEAFRPAWESMEAASTQKGMHSNNHDQGTSKNLYERNSEAEFLSREASTDSWPESNVLTRRLKRLVEHLMQVNEQVL
ncbi:hypothetical protein KP509_32G038000 [Ceratopteris richardii]|nr:hypothetical protein KP509_32G038000 [Ceratopteris richardii]